jgi:8-oxo-dGTP pyrophosphatase MutT (NUDIX family)
VPLAGNAAVDYLIPMARRERSAGVILFQNKKQRRYLLLDYGRYWDFPKGHVEKGETDLQAALRELREETDVVDVRVVPGFAHQIRYFFRKNAALIDKIVVFFLAQTSSTKVRLSREHVGFEFLPFQKALRRLSYANAKALLRLAEEYLLRQTGARRRVDAT